MSKPQAKTDFDTSTNPFQDPSPTPGGQHSRSLPGSPYTEDAPPRPNTSANPRHSFHTVPAPGAAPKNPDGSTPPRYAEFQYQFEEVPEFNGYRYNDNPSRRPGARKFIPRTFSNIKNAFTTRLSPRSSPSPVDYEPPRHGEVQRRARRDCICISVSVIVFLAIIIPIIWAMMTGRMDHGHCNDEASKVASQMDKNAVFSLASDGVVWNWNLPVNKKAKDGPFEVLMKVTVNTKGKVETLQQVPMSALMERTLDGDGVGYNESIGLLEDEKV
ncbi:hypothetical protein BJ508DRAFT_314122 [Ascobolus immersus RN42]|uniref:Uncharacterized protein n=1 Tax=Ascobolus immersus RN42 TaxID=1160509 RepID=A0A3N4HMP4_ASCIM|nr:hypothetical protein BJ508DRAFT_314122 [Ascobolus immersus RN42]